MIPQGPHFLFTTLPGSTRRICRLGVSSRGDTNLTVADVHFALEHGVNFLNWCGTTNTFADAIAGLGPRREDILVCVQFEARTAADARRELRRILLELRTDCVDVLTFYYVEEPAEWETLIGTGGALEVCRAAQKAGEVRLLGLTTHKRSLAVTAARSGLLDLLMIRYNAAHRGAEKEVFPVTDALGMPVVVYTCLRWGGLLLGTPDDPPGFRVPRAPSWYRFALESPSVSVALMAPDNRAELEEDLSVLEARGPLAADDYERLAEHGARVRKHGGKFP